MTDIKGAVERAEARAVVLARARKGRLHTMDSASARQLGEDLRLILSALFPRVGKEEGWQPIETAPKDGTPVDLWISRHEPGLSAGPGRVPDCWFSAGKWWCYDDHGDGMCRSEVCHATHWMPLPPPPGMEGEG